MTKALSSRRTVLSLVTVLAASTALSACAPLVLGSAAAGAFVATDRRTAGMQLEDQTIELKARSRITDAIGDRGHINVNAYNRMILLTGEVRDEADKAAASQAAAATENARGVINELEVTLTSSLSSRSNDVLIAGKVKATFIDARDVMSNAFYVVVERGNVYLMGLVTEREAKRAAELAASIPGVKRVIKAFEIISEDELARKLPHKPDFAASGASAP